MIKVDKNKLLKKRYFIFLGLAFLFLILSFWSIYRPLSLKITVKNNQCQVFVDKKLIADCSLKNTLSPQKISIKINHDRDYLLISSFFKNRVTISSLNNRQSETGETIVQENKRRGFLQNLSYSIKTPFSGQVHFKDTSLTTNYLSLKPYKNFELTTTIINPADIEISTSSFYFWSRPLWHHESSIRVEEQVFKGKEVGTRYSKYLQLIFSKIALNIIFSMIILLASFVLTLLFLPLQKFFYSSIISKFFRLRFNAVIPLLLIGTIVYAFILITHIGKSILENIPHSQDEVAYLFQVKIFHLGKLFFPSLPENLRRFFDHEFIVNNGKWFGGYTPGTSLFLALGEIFKIANFITPIFGILSLIFIFFLAKSFFSNKVAILSITLMLISPFFLLLSASYMSHTPALFFTVSTLYFLAKRYYFLSGTMLGLLFITRPFNSLLLALFISLYLFVKFVIILIKTKMKVSVDFHKLFKIFAKTSFPLIIFISFQFFYNYILSGSILKFPPNIYSPYNTVGFGQKGLEWPLEFTPLNSLKNVTFNFYSLTDMLFAWPYFLTLSFIPFAFLAKNKVVPLLLLMLFFVHVLAYFFYFGMGTFYDPRYWFESIFALIMLTAAGIINLFVMLKNRFGRIPAFMSIACIALTLIIYGNIRLFSILNLHKGYNGMHKVAVPNVEKPALIFIEGQGAWLEYGRYFIQQSPSLTDQIIFARDKAIHNVPKDLPPLDNQLLINYFKNRKPYLLKNNNLVELHY